MFGISLAEFNKSYIKNCISKWDNHKNWRLGQRKCKAYKIRERALIKKRKTFDIRELSSSDEITTDNENTSDDELN